MARIGWGLLAALLVAAPLLAGDLALTLLAQTLATAVVLGGLALAVGQGGLVGFCHAVFAGLGAAAVLHALRAAPLPAAAVAALPLLGALAGAAGAALLGALACRRSGLVFAMITLGLGELAHALALMLPDLFGGETGLRADRARGPATAGLDFAAPVAVYALVVAWAGAAAWALAGLRRTPFGLLLAAARDEPDRVAALGHGPAALRWGGFTAAGAFAGLGGALLALLFESVSAEALSTHRSGLLLMFALIGGTAGLAGPLLGAALLVFAQGWLSAWTPAWGLYVGLLFLAVVLTAPDGLAAWRPRRADRRAMRRAGGGALAALGAVLAAELLYRARFDPTLVLEPPALAAGVALAASLLAAGLAIARRA